MNPEWFGSRLRELREQAGLSRQQLADKAGLKIGGIRDLEQGRRSPVWETVLALCQALAVDCSAFTEEPVSREAPGPGRPRKAEPVEEKPSKPKGKTTKKTTRKKEG